MRALILAAGEPAPDALLARLATRSQRVIAVDGGVGLARAAGLALDGYVGDGDSLEPGDRRWLEETGVPARWHPVEKDQTDLELALEFVLADAPDKIEILGAWGLRADHTLSNLFLLERAARAGVPAGLWAGWERLCVLRPGAHALRPAMVGGRVSLLPLSARVVGVRTRGLKYALHRDTLRRAAGRGVSNVVDALPVSVAFESGTLAVVQAFGPDELAAL